MNQDITKLVRQALKESVSTRVESVITSSIDDRNIVTNGIVEIPNTFAEKFAELIVQECIECAKEWRDAVRVGSDRDYSKGYVHGCDDAIVEMKIRFGVKE